MDLLNKVETELKAAMKNRDQAKVDCLRLISNALKLKAKETLRDLNSEEALQTLKNMVKQRRESIAIYSAAGRNDLEEKERGELAIIESYLPAQMDASAVNDLLDAVFKDINPQGANDMGKIMKEAMKRTAGRADGKLVNELARRRFV
jgi:uncharacterized protein YqeY